jgi:CRISPR/Cas system CMR subunit Cmr6 (Cas7 group RAMP superfamily)|tara:strand:+ start:3504 stop:3704 length:201 start_codon:yes stop_codon:yes gene_type:complete
MFAIASPVIFAANNKNKGFKKLSKKIQRDTDVGKIKEKFSDIIRDEQRRMKEYLKEHDKSINFYEK